jgi:hypothetical protein
MSNGSIVCFFFQFCDIKIGIFFKKLEKLGKFTFENFFKNNISHEESFSNFFAKKATNFVSGKQKNTRTHELQLINS